MMVNYENSADNIIYQSFKNETINETVREFQDMFMKTIEI